MRMSAQQRRTIAAAAAALDRSETDFMLEASVHEAERVLADRRWFVVDADAWKSFNAMLDAPVPYEDDLRRRNDRVRAVADRLGVERGHRTVAG